MARPDPHPLAIFSLCPYSENEGAMLCINHPENLHNVSRQQKGGYGLDVGFHLPGSSSGTLATLGRGIGVDIYLAGSAISRIQCTFEIDLNTGFIMLSDRSSTGSTQVFGNDALPFERERHQRRILVQANLNTRIGIGGVRHDLIQFELMWHQDPMQITTIIKQNHIILRSVATNPRVARTEDEPPTELPSQRETRLHTPGQLPAIMRYVTVGHKLGEGAFGTVHQAIDVDSGNIMAVKVIKRPKGLQQQAHWKNLLRREIEILSQLNHPHIVDYITSQHWNEPQVEIFMGLKEGTLQSLIECGSFQPFVIANIVLPQMLQALDCIASNRIVHRDVKPENILYVTDPNDRSQILFQLGDFGLAKYIVDPASFAGSRIFMAPEMFQGGSNTTKLDIWSLFVTMMWTLDTQGFRQNQTYYQSQPETTVQRLIYLRDEEITFSYFNGADERIDSPLFFAATLTVWDDNLKNTHRLIKPQI
ncbi:kinase-like protein [Aaosphaeria arxii CBS 175.79]|uniref:mitogen-activated protein kinase n=1 Tax=Aaosphaeria arxii CBS 175.79 TaxID=1450172 RepID=A0A6A5Y9M3_9PLEO|nr:kinase-like protein [Aaosphaeria arxii CBS 175.79]KAF2022282.1 kinase-like protein [Aaosphaeria arxii CBS 175.79]